MATSSQGADSTAKLSNMETSTSPVELSTLQSAATKEEQSPSQTQSQQQAQQETDTTAGAQSPSSPTSPSGSPPSITAPAPAPLTRMQTEALGPATEAPIAPPPTSDRGPTLSITLMLTTGARHPYKIDEKYLRNRKVESLASDGQFDPREISGYKLKELIWTDWRGEWEPRPASPSSIRLIILGRLVDDKAALKDFPFKLDDSNVLHMTIKPADFLDDDDTGGKGTGKGHSIRGRDGEERGAGCRCVIL